MALCQFGLGLGGLVMPHTDYPYPVLPEDDGTDRPRNPYGPH